MFKKVLLIMVICTIGFAQAAEKLSINNLKTGDYGIPLEFASYSRKTQNALIKRAKGLKTVAERNARKEAGLLEFTKNIKKTRDASHAKKAKDARRAKR